MHPSFLFWSSAIFLHHPLRPSRKTVAVWSALIFLALPVHVLVCSISGIPVKKILAQLAHESSSSSLSLIASRKHMFHSWGPHFYKSLWLVYLKCSQVGNYHTPEDFKSCLVSYAVLFCTYQPVIDLGDQIGLSSCNASSLHHFLLLSIRAHFQTCIGLSHSLQPLAAMQDLKCEKE